MKDFSDLIFEPHHSGSGLSAKMFFENGFGISVIRFAHSYTSNDEEWEAAVLDGNEKNWELCYNTPITDDVIGHLTDNEVSELMKKIQELPKR